MRNSASSKISAHDTKVFDVTSINILSDLKSLSATDSNSTSIGTSTSDWHWVALGEVTAIGSIDIAEHLGTESEFSQINERWRSCVNLGSMSNTSWDWIVVADERRGTVDTSAKSSGAINLLSDGDLFGDGVLIVGSITIVALVANGNIWITRDLILADPEVPWRSCVNRELGVEWSNQGSCAISLEQDTIQDWASYKRGGCCCLWVCIDLRIVVNNRCSCSGIVTIFFGSDCWWCVCGQGVAVWQLNNLPVIKGDNWVSSVLALNTEIIFISCIDILFHRYFSRNIVDDNISKSISSGATSLLDHTVVDQSAKSGTISGLQIEWVGEEDGTVGSGSVQSSDTKSELNRNSWVNSGLSCSDESSSAVSKLFNLEVVMSDCASSKISALNTENLGVTSINILLDR
jgi:hypothetical protein